MTLGSPSFQQRGSSTQASCHLAVQQARPWRTVEQVEFATLEYVWWWNNQRLHGKRDTRTPLEVEQAYYGALESTQSAHAGQGNT